MIYKILLALLLTGSTLALKAQSYNNGFELTDSTGAIAHWNRIYTTSAWFDSTGQSGGLRNFNSSRLRGIENTTALNPFINT